MVGATPSLESGLIAMRSSGSGAALLTGTIVGPQATMGPRTSSPIHPEALESRREPPTPFAHEAAGRESPGSEHEAVGRVDVVQPASAPQLPHHVPSSRIRGSDDCEVR